MHVFVTGAGGFIGRHIVRHLLDAGHAVHAHHRATQILTRDRLHIHQGGLEIGFSLPSDIDVVIHAAGASQPGGTHESYEAGNVGVTRNLIAALRKSRTKKAIFMSSMAVAGLGRDAVVDESTSPVSPDAYGLSKQHCEELFAAEAATCDSLMLRLPNVLGPDCRGHFISNTFERLKRHERVQAFNPEGLFNSAIHVEDLCRFVGHVIEVGWTRTEPLCLGGAEPMTLAALVQRLASGCGSRSEIQWLAPRRPPYLISSRRAQVEYAYQPASIKDAIDRYIRDELQMGTATPSPPMITGSGNGTSNRPPARR